MSYMDVETTQTILVIFLSVTLAVFLTLAIISIVKIIQLLDVLKRIAEKAENIAGKAEHLGDLFQKTAGPLAIGRFFTHIADNVLNREKSKSSKR